MGTEGVHDDGDADTRDRPPQKSSLDAAADAPVSTAYLRNLESRKVQQYLFRVRVSSLYFADLCWSELQRRASVPSPFIGWSLTHAPRGQHVRVGAFSRCCRDGLSSTTGGVGGAAETDTAHPSWPSVSMSAAVASVDLDRSPHPSSSSLVGGASPAIQKNPLSAALSRHASLQALSESSEPAQKKRRINNSDNGVVGTATAVSSENDSSCDSLLAQKPSQSSLGGGANTTTNNSATPQPAAAAAGSSFQRDGDSSVKSPVSPPATGAPGDKPLSATTEITATLAQANTQPVPTPATVKPTPSQNSLDASSAAQKPQEKLPLKSTKMSHLRQKYTAELEYMLREFEKLERQLLGARKTEESAASRERREKLHSFILHLTETIQQIAKGCELEAAGKSALPAIKTGATEESSTSLANPSSEKEEEESIQKLEEHILANLLPVKVRLKKQLAAQQGAKHNPATMPHRGGHAVRPDATAAGTTFADAARRQQEASQAMQRDQGSIPPPGPVAPDETQFGKPLVTGSSLTKKLHGPTLGSSDRANGDGVGATESATTAQKKKYIAGLAVGSTQMESSFDAASNVHKLVIQEPALVLQTQVAYEETAVTQLEKRPPPTQAPQNDNAASSVPGASQHAPRIVGDGGTGSMGDEKRRKLLKKKRKKMRLREQAKAAAAEKRKLDAGRKQKMVNKSHRGPRHVEYMCALCNEVYNSTCEYNPWWALTQHDCPKCRKRQIPRIDIAAPSNAIEYHPALLAHADDNGGVASAHVAPVTEVPPPSASNGGRSDEDSLGVSDVSSDCGDISTDDDDSFGSDVDTPELLSPADRAERERFGAEYSGPTLQPQEASRLLVLMAHASTCPGQHNSQKHRDTCRSVKWMMLHVRDCPGTTANSDVCPFPWCRKVKHLLYHLVSCEDPHGCQICSPSDHGMNLVRLRELNGHRFHSFREKLLAKFPASCPKAPPLGETAPMLDTCVATNAAQSTRPNGNVSSVKPAVNATIPNSIADGDNAKPLNATRPSLPSEPVAESEPTKPGETLQTEPNSVSGKLPAPSRDQESTAENNTNAVMSHPEVAKSGEWNTPQVPTTEPAMEDQSHPSEPRTEGQDEVIPIVKTEASPSVDATPEPVAAEDHLPKAAVKEEDTSSLLPADHDDSEVPRQGVHLENTKAMENATQAVRTQ